MVEEVSVDSRDGTRGEIEEVNPLIETC